MQVEALDHVNIMTGNLDGTCRYYCDLLGLDRRNGPAPLPAEDVQWLYDAGDRPILHINSLGSMRLYDREIKDGPTGAIHHVALRCQGFDRVAQRLETRGADFHVNLVESIGLRQIFTHDPNGVLLELNFFENA